MQPNSDSDPNQNPSPQVVRVRSGIFARIFKLITWPIRSISHHLVITFGPVIVLTGLLFYPYFIPTKVNQPLTKPMNLNSELIFVDQLAGVANCNGQNLHDATGQIFLHNRIDGVYLDFDENFKIDNAHMLRLYVNTVDNRHVSLGKLIGSEGAQNYYAPGVNLSSAIDSIEIQSRLLANLTIATCKVQQSAE